MWWLGTTAKVTGSDESRSRQDETDLAHVPQGAYMISICLIDEMIHGVANWQLLLSYGPKHWFWQFGGYERLPEVREGRFKIMGWSQLYHSDVNPDWLRQEKSWMTSISCFHMYRPYSTGIVRRKKKMWWSMPITMSVIDRWWPCEKRQQALIHVAKLRWTLLAERAKELTLAKSHLILSTRDLWKAALQRL